MKYKVCWIVLCKNELDILPFVSKYWERIADKVVVYDNGSTDGSLEYLAKLPYVEIRHFDSNGQNDLIQKKIKEDAYLEYKDSFDIIIISDMDEIFYFKNEAVWEAFIDGEYNVLATPIYSLCEDSKPIYEEGKLLHQQCKKFYKQRMNHMKNFDDYSKLSIFNCHNVEKIYMSVGQHFVQTMPVMRIMLSNDGFCLHIDKGLSEDFYVAKRKKMAENLSDTNKKYGMCVEYSKSEEASRKEYRQHQEKSFDINLFI